MDALDLGDLHIHIRWSTRRKTLGLTVERDGSLTLAAPATCPLERLRKFAESRRFWIYVQLAKRNLLGKPVPIKEFVSGEGFTYLGRNHRLKLVDPNGLEPLRLVAGRFELHRDRLDDAEAVFRAWFVRNGRAWLTRRVQRLAPEVGVEPTGVQVQDLGYRWGSCGRNRRLYFSWRVMTLPASLIEYVIAHELVHLHEPHHTPAFWRRVARVLPDFERRKQALAEHGGQL